MLLNPLNTGAKLGLVPYINEVSDNRKSTDCEIFSVIHFLNARNMWPMKWLEDAAQLKHNECYPYLIYDVLVCMCKEKKIMRINVSWSPIWFWWFKFCVSV